MPSALPDELRRSSLLAIPYGQWGRSDVAEAREILHFTQQDLAYALDYTRQGVGKIEGGGPVPRAFELAVRFLLIVDKHRIPTDKIRLPLGDEVARFLDDDAIPVLLVDQTGKVEIKAWVYDRSGIPHFVERDASGRLSSCETRDETIEFVSEGGSIRIASAFVLVPVWL
jgi:DNA-binding XRE family transcriptional regulator